MKNKIFNNAILAICLLCMASCKKEDNTVKSGSMQFTFNNTVGADNLKMDGTWYKDQNGDSFTVTKFNYYISNIQFNKTDGSFYAEPENYHLMQQSDPASLVFDISSVPGGAYNSVTYTIGVDSLHNVSGAQSGALDPVNGMFWSWSTGYIMLKVEGVSPQSTQSGNIFMLHAGGFKGAYTAVRTITLTFPSTISINGDAHHLYLNADLQKVLGGNSAISFATTSVVMSAGTEAKVLADNYQNMFSVGSASK